MKASLPESSIPNHRELVYKILALGAFVFLLVVVYRAAWTGDDAFIGYRAAYNLLHGYGPNYNIGERVQVYTHPLYFGVETLCFALTGEYFFTGMFLGLILTGLAVWIFGRSVRSWPVFGGAVLCFIASKAFIDYSTAGLENSLAYLMVVAFAIVFTSHAVDRRKLLLVSFFSALLFLTRQDLILMALPAVLYQIRATYRSGQKVWPILLTLALGWMPIAIWEVFSIIYYGFPFPNTYYAKTTGGIPKRELIVQGIMYVLNFFSRDPGSAIAILAGAAMASMLPNARHRALLIGVLVYLLYVVQVGGDFMSGRFFAIPFFLCVWVVAKSDVSLPGMQFPITLGLGVFMFIVSLADVNPTWQYGRETVARIESRQIPVYFNGGMSDERLGYFELASLGLHIARDLPYPTMVEKREADSAYVHGVPMQAAFRAGAGPFYGGPSIYYVDIGAIGDPLLSRLPEYYPFCNRGKWRIGHVEHWIPAGYQETILTGENKIKDKNIREFYDHLKPVISGPLFSATRWMEIWRFNIGFYRNLVKDVHCYEYEQGYQNYPELQMRFPGTPRPLYHKDR